MLHLLASLLMFVNVRLVMKIITIVLIIGSDINDDGFIRSINVVMS